MFTSIDTRENKHKEAANEAHEIARPFLRTDFGKLAAETRESIFLNLLATPPPHAGREVSVPYHLRASHLAVLHTCRQMYLEAFPIFYDRESYYAANAQELIHILKFGQSDSPGLKNFRAETITTLCVKDLIRRGLGYRLFEHRNSFQIGGHQTSRGEIDIQYLDDQTISAVRNLNTWTSLNKICLCMRVGEEIGFIQLLFEIPGLEQGMLDIYDDYKWAVRPQPQHRPDQKDGLARSQWLCSYVDTMGNRTYVELDRFVYSRKELEYRSRASKRLRGDERYVEVDIIRHNKESQEIDNVSMHKTLLNWVLSTGRISLSLIAGLIALVITFYLYLLMGADSQHTFLGRVSEMIKLAMNHL